MREGERCCLLRSLIVGKVGEVALVVTEIDLLARRGRRLTRRFVGLVVKNFLLKDEVLGAVCMTLAERGYFAWLFGLV